LQQSVSYVNLLSCQNFGRISGFCMLGLFRKFQKVLFSIVTFFLIVAFLFFGVFSSFDFGSESADQVAGRAVDGSDVYLSEKQRLVRFLSLDPHDPVQPGGTLHVLNDGVIRKDFLESGIGDLLAASFFDQIKEDLEARLAKAKRYQPYKHPEAPFLSAESVWEQFQPDLSRYLTSLKGQLEASPETFTYLSRLYLEQKKMPPELLRRILVYQMSQYSSLRFDPAVQYGDMSLFGQHTLHDWFGDRFIELAAEFVWNAAVTAHEKGIEIGIEEAKADLLFSFEEASQAFAKHKGKMLSLQDQLRYLGMNESEAVSIWQKILLFRQYMKGASDPAFVDSAFSDELLRYTGEVVLADVYHLPDALSLKTPDDFFAFQYYIDAVSAPEKDRLALPKAYLPIGDIAKKSPDFVETLFTARVSKISEEELALRVSLKEQSDWQLDHWETLEKQFSLPAGKHLSREERIKALGGFPASKRAEIDSWAALQVVREHPEWIQDAFAGAEPIEQTISFSVGRVNLPYVKDVKGFLELLEKASSKDPNALEKLLSYPGDRSSLLRFAEVTKTADRKLRSFASMKEDKTLRRLVDAHLRSQYPKIREKTPDQFQTKSGDFMSFNEAKEIVGWAVYADVCRAMEAGEKFFKPTKEFYVQRRFVQPVRKALERFQKTQETPVEQFCWIAKEQKIRRTLEPNWLEEEAFSLKPGEWSRVDVSELGELLFCHVKEQNIEPAEVTPGQIAKALIASEVRQTIAKRLIHRMQGIIKNHV